MSSVDYAAQWADAPVEEIVARLGWLLDQMKLGCNCEPARLEVRLRTTSNGSKHHVMQCMGCGEQRGNALGGKAAKALLGDRSAEAFDDQVHTAYFLSRRALSDEHCALDEIWLSRERPEVLPSLRAAREADEARSERIKAAVARCVEELQGEVSESQVADALSKEAVAIRKRHRLALVEATKRFKSEPELKAWLEAHLSEDFILKPEVVGKHMSEGVRVQIDYIAYAKPHLIAHGFEPVYFGIEVKFLDQTDGFTHKASRGIWQTVSYTDSTFFVDGEWRRLKFALFFSNLCFDEERELLEGVGMQPENDRVTWRALLQLANHANVGSLEILGNREAWRGWAMAFSSGRYFRRSMRDGQAVYHLSNANMINKVRIGNF
jgi:hypothetical protein